MKPVNYVIGFMILSSMVPIRSGHAHGNMDVLLNDIRKNSERIKKNFTGGEFECTSREFHSLIKEKDRSYYFAFNNDKTYLRSREKQDGYEVQVKDKSYSVTLEPERDGTNKIVKLVTFSRMKSDNNITANGLLLHRKYVCDALGDFSNPKQGTDPKWGDYVEVDANSEFKGDKVQDIYRISREGLVFHHEQKLKRGIEEYSLKNDLLEVKRTDSVIIPMERYMEKHRIDGGRNELVYRKRFKVTNFRLGKVDDRLFVVDEKAGDRFKDGDSWDYWKVEPDGKRTYIDISGGVVERKRLIGSIFVLSLSLTLIIAATWWVRRKLTTAAAI